MTQNMMTNILKQIDEEILDYRMEHPTLKELKDDLKRSVMYLVDKRFEDEKELRKASRRKINSPKKLKKQLQKIKEIM